MRSSSGRADASPRWASCIGLAGSFALTRYLQSLLFGVAPNDPATLVAVCVLLACVTLAACLVPASRAASVDPSAALRSE